ncbi:MAG: proline--tRNA ligase [Sulfobacillus sp.]
MAERSGFVREITPPDEDYSQWYQEVVTKADLADYGPVKGFIVIKPAGYALWENIQTGLDRRFKATGHVNAYFPLLIPESLLIKEADHVAGFTPEVAWVTQGGQETLSERLAIRPTSEVMVGAMYAKWVHSYRDLPILINQWNNVVRWEKVTRPFLRGTEFLWQEGHTAHASGDEAMAETLRMLEVYHEFLQTELAIPSRIGRKSESEKFAGAEITYSLEAMMGDNRALQAGTSHYFGTRFADAYGIRFLDQDGVEKSAFTTSWGMSTRVIGALIMVHGDARGLVLPPKVAPTQVVVVPIGANASAEVAAAARALQADLSLSLRVHLDDRPEFTPGWKFNEWEMRGIPLRLELGPRDLAASQVVAVRRDTGEKQPLPIAGLAGQLSALLERMQGELLERATRRLAEHTHAAADYAVALPILTERQGWVEAGWCGSERCEEQVKADSGATLRNLPLEQKVPATCLVCGAKAHYLALWGRAY